MNRKKTIFVVEDDQSVRHCLVRYFSKFDVEVKALANGFEALLLCMYWTPDLILCDVRMPKLDGVSLLQGLRNSPQTKDVPVVFMSAFPSDQIMERVRELGAKHFLIKPFPMECLDKTIDFILPNLPRVAPIDWQAAMTAKRRAG